MRPTPMSLSLALAFASAAFAAAPTPQRGNGFNAMAGEGMSSAFVHLFEWSWADIAVECEQWLGPKGFKAVQVSPPNEHIEGEQWWTRYQPVTYKLVSRSGNESAFIDMVQRCKKAGVGIYVDAVFNHIASGSGRSIAGNSFGNRATPIYSANDMHHDNGNTGRNCGISNYADKHNVQYCDLAGLPDLCTSCDYVQKTVAAYINHLSDIGIAGFRIDAAKHMNSDELGQLLAQTDQKLFRFQEVISGIGEAVTEDQYFKIGAVTEFDYGRMLAPNFIAEGKLQYFNSFGSSWGLMPPEHAVVFLDNHDTQRGEAGLTYKKGKLYELANIFMLAHPYGYPKVMSSYYFDSHDQGPPGTPVHSRDSVACGGQPMAVSADESMVQAGGPWVCEHRWPAVANMVAWRGSAGTNEVTGFQAPGGDTIAFCRGKTACVALNRQNSATWSVTLKFTLPAGKYCDVIRSDDASSCPTVSIAADGSTTLQVPPLGAVALHIGKTAQMEQIIM
mmetsp:Transcript_53734/g.156654  ORF Transcript_53734/g.156654 Transcript_53734/m.156654 type:complete len:503 (-) Transcript_53734:215-1723(-)